MLRCSLKFNPQSVIRYQQFALWVKMSNIGIPIMEIDEDSEITPIPNVAEKLIKTWKKGMKLLDRFCQIWRNIYIFAASL